MFRQFILLSALVLVGLGLMGTRIFAPANASDKGWNADTPVWEVLNALGEPLPDHGPKDSSPENIRRGMELVTMGTTTSPDGKQTRIQSRYFVCTSCHNMKKEDPDLRASDPEKRLDYALKQDMPFLQGTTMYGTVNKESWYNGDYYKKYGDLVKPANKSLEEAIKLCAVVCSQGRAFNEWEMDAVKAYLWSLQLKMGDLNLAEADWEKVRSAGKNGGNNQKVSKLVKNHFLSGSPATFAETPKDKGEGYETKREPNAERGKQVYDLACLHCHDQQGPSRYLKLDHGALSKQLFRKNMERKGHLSLYEIVRHGTYADKGHRAYMPHYTLERMSNAQVEDLRAYFEAN